MAFGIKCSNLAVWFLIATIICSSTSLASESPSFQPSTSLSPTAKPSASPTPGPTPSPSKSPTSSPSGAPTSSPSETLSLMPSEAPTNSAAPSPSPSSKPTPSPTTSHPSSMPSSSPTSMPTMSMKPTNQPSAQPTPLASGSPSKAPTYMPSIAPTRSQQPTTVPTSPPTMTMKPTVSTSPSNLPTSVPTHQPTSMPSTKPSSPPTSTPTSQPSISQHPTASPSFEPSISLNPTNEPTKSPTTSPTLSSKPSSSNDVLSVEKPIDEEEPRPQNTMDTVIPIVVALVAMVGAAMLWILFIRDPEGGTVCATRWSRTDGNDGGGDNNDGIRRSGDNVTAKDNDNPGPGGVQHVMSDLELGEELLSADIEGVKVAPPPPQSILSDDDNRLSIRGVLSSEGEIGEMDGFSLEPYESENDSMISYDAYEEVGQRRIETEPDNENLLSNTPLTPVRGNGNQKNTASTVGPTTVITGTGALENVPVLRVRDIDDAVEVEVGDDEEVDGSATSSSYSA